MSMISIAISIVVFGILAPIITAVVLRLPRFVWQHGSFFELFLKAQANCSNENLTASNVQPWLFQIELTSRQ